MNLDEKCTACGNKDIDVVFGYSLKNLAAGAVAGGLAAIGLHEVGFEPTLSYLALPLGAFVGYLTNLPLGPSKTYVCTPCDREAN